MEADKMMCFVSRPDLKNKVEYQGASKPNERIELVVPIKEHKRIYVLTENGTLIKYHNSHGKVVH